MTDQEKIDLLRNTLGEYAKVINWKRSNYNQYSHVDTWVGIGDGNHLAKTVLDIIKKDEIIPKS